MSPGGGVKTELVNQILSRQKHFLFISHSLVFIPRVAEQDKRLNGSGSEPREKKDPDPTTKNVTGSDLKKNPLFVLSKL